MSRTLSGGPAGVEPGPYDDETPAPDLYQFTYRAVARRDDPYYYTNWDNAKDYDVVAENVPEALTKLWALLGPAPTHREWTAKLMRTKDIRIVQAEATS